MLTKKLRPPKSWDDVVSPCSVKWAEHLGLLNEPSAATYVRLYNNGWQAGKSGEYSPAWESGKTDAPWDDGYLDRVAGREKWHLTHCTNHDTCGEA